VGITGDYSEILGPGWHFCPRQAENVTGRISQVLTAAVILAMVCPVEIAVLRILIGEGVLLRSMLHNERVLK
jgi:hypothetical protein